jgi:hypothetical protein
VTPLEETKATGGSKKETIPIQDSKIAMNKKERVVEDPAKNSGLMAPHGHQRSRRGGYTTSRSRGIWATELTRI